MNRAEDDEGNDVEAEIIIDGPPRRSLRRRSSERAAEDGDGLHQDDDSIAPDNQPIEVSMSDPSEAVSRRTRSASSRLRRRSGNSTPSECCFCPDPNLFDGKEIESELIGPFVNRRGQAKLFVHFDCACWAPQVFTDVQTGQLRRVFDEYCRGRKLKCSECGGRGATIGCYVQKCKHVFHLRCLAKSGARKVVRYFVAFCSSHAHLGDKKSYQILLEAGTIADVAAAQRRQDSTFGLDAPHSRYTQLRRRETEVIFSSKLRICSHTGAFETSKVVFSHKRKRVLSKSDRLSASDHARALLVSAFDVASGRLAYMSVAGREKSETMTAVEARAALASRETSSLLLLRNLRRAPTWTRDQITVIQRSDDDVSKAGVVAPALELSSLDPCTRATDVRMSEEGDVTHRVKRSSSRVCPESETPKTSEYNNTPRRSKRRHVNTSSSDDESPPISRDKSEINQEQSVALPTFKKADTSICFASSTPSEQKQHEEPLGRNPDRGITEQKSWSEKRVREERVDDIQMKKQRVSLQVSPDNAKGTGEDRSARQGSVDKVKSAWETFLEEQLPKERLLRPDDNEAAAVKNMARLWSLLSPQAREEYHERAKRAAYEPANEKNISDASDASKDLKETGSDGSGRGKKVAAEAGQTLISGNDPGLFAGRGKVSLPSGKNTEAIKDSFERRQSSVSLPRKRYRGKGTGAQAHYDLVAVDWDDLLPTSLGSSDLVAPVPQLAHNETSSCERVRRAPFRSKNAEQDVNRKV